MKRDLTLEILNRNRRAARFDAVADPEDPAALRKILVDWLKADGWDEGLWGRFELIARFQGDGRIRQRVRV